MGKQDHSRRELFNFRRLVKPEKVVARPSPQFNEQALLQDLYRLSYNLTQDELADIIYKIKDGQYK